MFTHVESWRGCELFTALLEDGADTPVHPEDGYAASALAPGRVADRFLRGRVLLRRMVAIYKPGASLVVGSEGGPRLAVGQGWVSHARSGEFWLGAYSRTGQVGVDCEIQDGAGVPRNEELGIDFSAESLSRQYRLWVRYEALVKAAGHGLLGGGGNGAVDGLRSIADGGSGTLTLGDARYCIKDLNTAFPSAVCLQEQ